MTLDDALYAHLSGASGDPAAAAVVALVGTRIYPLRLPQAPAPVTFPAVTITRISTMPASPLAGASTLERMRYQCDCWAYDVRQARAVAAAVSAALDGFDGTLGGTGGVTTRAITLGQHDQYDPTTQLSHPAVDVALWAPPDAA